VNKSQENWPDAQLSLSTAIPSLGGAPPKLTTLKIDYYRPQYDYPRSNDYDRLGRLDDLCVRSAVCELEASQFSSASRKTKKFMSLRGRSSLSSKQIIEEEEDPSAANTVNVLSTTAEASMSSTSFNIPRRSTIDADVSFFSFSNPFFFSKPQFFL
jgi:hypothetical protein